MLTVKKFGASWCAPCKMINPILDRIKNNYADVIFESIDIDEQSDLAQKMGVRAVPTIIFEKDGVIVDTLVGLHKEKTITDLINKWK